MLELITVQIGKWKKERNELFKKSGLSNILVNPM